MDSLDLTKDNILSVRYSFHVKYFKEVSSNAKDLVSKMIMKEKRYPTLPSHTHTHTHTHAHAHTHTHMHTHTHTHTHTHAHAHAHTVIDPLPLSLPSDRLTSTQCLSHPWLASKSPKNSRHLNTARLKSYLTSRKWQVIS